MIYDHNSKEGNNKVILAKKGAMYLSENEQYFIISLEDGHSYYESNLATRNKDKKNRTHQRIKFEKDILRFDLSGFGMKSSEDLYRNHYAMMNNKQLSTSIDSLFLKLYNKSEEAYKNIVKKIHPDTSLKKPLYQNLKT